MDEADKMNKMVKKLLTLNQLEFGNEVITMERFDLTELIRGVINSSAILLNQNEITLDFTQQEPLYAWADEFKVEEVVTNYLSNAIHHAEGEKRIDISCVQKGDKVRVSVLTREIRYRKKMWTISGSNFTKWIKREPENTVAAASVCQSSGQSWIRSIRSAA